MRPAGIQGREAVVPVLELPDRPSLDNLRKQARTLQRLVRSGLPGALDTVTEFHPRLGSMAPDSPLLGAFSLADAQLVLARQYGFPSWPRLRQYLADVARYTREPHRQPTRGPAAAGPADLADDFLRLACLVYDGYDPARIEQAERILAEHPEVARASIWTSAAAGEHEHITALLAADPALAGRSGGPFNWEPLLYACYARASPGPGRSTLEAARRLLAAGADPNVGYLWAGLPSPFTALTGALGRGEGAPPAHPQSIELATRLLEAGADANDSQALYNCGLQSPPDDDGYLRLLLRFGLGRGTGGPWHERLAPVHHSPRQLLDQELIKAVRKDLPDRVALLLADGADPAGPGIRPGGHTAREWATLGGRREILDLLATTGPAPPADPVLVFLGACMAGDADQVRALRAADPGITAEAMAREPDVLADAAEENRPAAVRLLVQSGYDVNMLRRAGGYSPLHGAAWNGHLDMVALLLDLGADPAAEDRTHHGTPADWAARNHQADTAAFLATRTDPEPGPPA
jgi:ankyrin repeat protein